MVVVDGDPRALGGQAQRDLAADSLGGAGDESYFSGEWFGRFHQGGCDVYT